MDGVEMGFIPDWSQFTTGEWIDMETHTKDVWSNAHRIMSLLYRPVSEQIGDAYHIEPYNAKEDHDRWLDCPAQWFAGAMLFFSTSRRRLLNSTRLSLTEATDRLIELARSGDGTTSSTPSLVKTSSRWTGSLRRLFKSSYSTSRTYKTFTT
jgi:hypothetical protein